jgi:hypothetical protein
MNYILAARDERYYRSEHRIGLAVTLNEGREPGIFVFDRLGWRPSGLMYVPSIEAVPSQAAPSLPARTAD